jgi:hypothetical protein
VCYLAAVLFMIGSTREPAEPPRSKNNSGLPSWPAAVRQAERAAKRLRAPVACTSGANRRRHLTRIRRLTALCLLFCAVVIIGLAISGALKEARSPVPQLASHK